MMLDELRNHDPRPTEAEARWMKADAVHLVLRALALAGIAIVAGVSASVVIERAATAPAVASAPHLAP